jgi:hypothetical protein
MKKPELPTRALIGPVTYDIKYQDYTKFNTKTTLGTCSTIADHQIRINVDHPEYEEELVDTILHEFIHAMDHVYEINLKEQQVHDLARAFTHFIEYNPHIPYWIEKHQNWLEEQS